MAISPIKVYYVQHTSPILPNTAPILNVLIQMKNDNKANSTIDFTRKALAFLAKHTSLSEPEAVKHFIAQMESKNGYKKKRICAFLTTDSANTSISSGACLFIIPEEKDITPAKKDKILMLIAEAGNPLSIKIQLSMETGMRPVELCRLIARDVHIEERTVTPITAKRGNPRTLKISSELVTRIQEHIIRNNLSPTDKLFKGTSSDYGKQYREMRNRLAKKLNDPAIHQIRLYDLRHYFCTKKLYDIKNPYVVMTLMGHKKLTTTQKYMHLLNLDDEEWICEGATTLQEAKKLIEAGFEYITEIDGTKLFRKRK